MSYANTFSASLNSCYDKVLATSNILSSPAFIGIAKTLPLVGRDPMVAEALSKIRNHVMCRSAAVNPIEALIENARIELGRVAGELMMRGAVSSRSCGDLAQATLREIDAALSSDGGASIIIKHSESRDIAAFVRTFEAAEIQHVIGSLVATYRFATGDYDRGIPAEAAFCDVAGMLLPHVSDYFSDLLQVDRDAVFSAIEGRIDAFVVGSRECGSGTYGLIFAAGKPVTLSIITQCFSKSETLVRVTQEGVQKVAFSDVVAMAKSYVSMKSAA